MLEEEKELTYAIKLYLHHVSRRNGGLCPDMVRRVLNTIIFGIVPALPDVTKDGKPVKLKRKVHFIHPDFNPMETEDD